MFLNSTTQAEGAGIIKKLNNNKLTGVDEISSYILLRYVILRLHVL
jgi:hypothetical protein